MNEPVVKSVRVVNFMQEPDAVLVTVTHAEGESGLGAEWPTRALRFSGNWDKVLPAFAEFLKSEDSVFP